MTDVNTDLTGLGIRFASRIGIILLCWVPSAANATTEGADCELGARYAALAEKAGEDLDQRKQLELLEKSVGACESYSAYLDLGATAASFANNEKTMRAAEAFSGAYELAANSQEQAMAIFGYAKLLHHTNNNQQALRYAYAARNLQPQNAAIAALAERVAKSATEITEDQIVRGFGRMALKPLQLKEDIGTGVQGTGGAAPSSTAKSINIPLNFDYGTTQLTADSSVNVEVIAEALADNYPDKDFLFVGHADVRGATSYNMALSIGRAQAVQAEVIRLRPSLTDKISIVGKGESTPLSKGNTEADHSVNRRLEIVIR